MTIQTFDLSGFGGEYEETVQKMVWAGVEFMQKNNAAEFPSRQYGGIYGVADNSRTPIGKKFDEAILSAAGDYGCSGAMHQCATNHALYIAKHGYNRWFKELSKRGEAPYEFEFNGTIQISER